MELTNQQIEALKPLLDLIAQNDKTHSNKIKLSEGYEKYSKWAKVNHRPKTVISTTTAYNHLLKFKGDVSFKEIDSLFADQFAVYLIKKVPKGYTTYFRTIRAMFTKFHEWDFISKNYFAKVRLPKQQKNEQKIFTEDEFLSFTEKEKNEVLKNLFRLAFYTGLRLAEIVSTLWENVNLSEKYILIGSSTFTTKSKKVRRVPLCNKAITILENIKPKVFSLSYKNYVFTKDNSFPFSKDYVSKKFKKLIRLAGMAEEYHFHSVRHSTASNLVASGVPLPAVQEILGHSQITTTMIYTHTDFNQLLKAINVFDNYTSKTINQTKEN